MILRVCIDDQIKRRPKEESTLTDLADCPLSFAKQSPSHILTVDISLFDCLIETAIGIATKLSYMEPPAHSTQHVSLAILVVHEFLSNYKFLRTILEAIDLPGGEAYWRLTYVGATGLASTFTWILLVQFFLGIVFGLKPKDAAVTCGILGTLLLEFVPCFSVVACLWLYLWKSMEFSLCAFSSITVSGISIALSMFLRRVVYASLRKTSCPS